MALEQFRRRATIPPPSVRSASVTVPDVASQSAVFGDDEATTEIGIILRRRSHFWNTTRIPFFVGKTRRTGRDRELSSSGENELDGGTYDESA